MVTRSWRERAKTIFPASTPLWAPSSCSTCHVYVHPDLGIKFLVSKPSEMEADMLDFAHRTEFGAVKAHLPIEGNQ